MIGPITTLLPTLAVLAAGWAGFVMMLADDSSGQKEKGEPLAPAPGFTRNVVVKSDLQGIEGKQMQAWVAEAAPGATSGRHYHPYDEFAYVLDGVFVLEVDGNPPVRLKAGESGHVPAKTLHEGKNGSQTSPTRVLVFGLTSKGEPLAVPAK